MSKLTVLIQGNHVISGNDGQPLSPGYEYAVKDTPLIQQYISEGFVTDVSPEAGESDKAPKKLAPSKTLTDQVTVPTNPQETSNG